MALQQAAGQGSRPQQCYATGCALPELNSLRVTFMLQTAAVATACLCVLEGVPSPRHVPRLRCKAGQVAPQRHAHYRCEHRCTQDAECRGTHTVRVHRWHNGTAVGGNGVWV